MGTFLTEALRLADKKTVSAKSKPKPKAKDKPKPKDKYKTGTCDLCGRRLTDRANHPYKHAVWCALCLRNHTIYPTPCQTCDGYYHFPEGITEVTDPMHLAKIADMERNHAAYNGTRPN